MTPTIYFAHFLTDVFGLKPDLNILWFPITLMLDMPIILILTVRSNDKKKVPIAMPPTGLQVCWFHGKKYLKKHLKFNYYFFQDNGEEFTCISISRVKSKRLKRRWSTNLAPNDCLFTLDQKNMMFTKKNRRCSN